MSENKTGEKPSAPESSLIEAHTYDPNTRTMTVTIRGKTYEHREVPIEKYAAFTGSASLGSFYNKKIKPHHKGTKV
jgi:hypothetical protein